MAKITFDYKDLVSFGNYMLRTKGRKLDEVIDPEVTHSDLRNWEKEEKIIVKAQEGEVKAKVITSIAPKGISFESWVEIYKRITGKEHE